MEFDTPGSLLESKMLSTGEMVYTGEMRQKVYAQNLCERVVDFAISNNSVISEGNGSDVIKAAISGCVKGTANEFMAESLLCTRKKVPQESEDFHLGNDYPTNYMEQLSGKYPDEQEISFVYDEKRNSIKLGSGTFGVVYLMEYANKEKLAMKEIPITNNYDDLYNEIQIHRELQHANIVEFLSYEETSKYMRIFVEFVPGGSLGSLLRNKLGKLNEEIVVHYGKQMLQAAEYLHSKNIVHCDIKGCNILVDQAQKICKLCDFGSACDLNLMDGKITKMLGTANFMSPESINIPKQGYGKPTDIWSIGCTFIEMLIGKPPHPNLEELTILYQVGKLKLKPAYPDSASESCKYFLQRCFTEEPSKRATSVELLNLPFITGSKKKSQPQETTCSSYLLYDDTYLPKEPFPNSAEIVYQPLCNVAMIKKSELNEEISHAFLSSKIERNECLAANDANFTHCFEERKIADLDDFKNLELKDDN